VVCAIAQALSALLARSTTSAVLSYLVVFALTVGTLIAFGLAVSMTTEQVTRTVQVPVGDPYEPGQRQPSEPELEEQTFEVSQTRPDRVWWLLAPNPFVVLADAAPTLTRRVDPVTGRLEWEPLDPLGEIGRGSRQLRNPPTNTGPSYEQLNELPPPPSPSRPVWPYGLAFNVLLGAVALAVTTWRLRTPSRNLPRGIRVA
jgi:ABC-2 type transport system permease protein